MTDLQNVGDLAGSTLSYIVPFLFVLCVVVFFHELGHFLVARWCGVRVQAFSLGFGPELFGRTDKHGTRWRLSAVPLGGYVKFHGDENAASVPSRERLEAMSPAERRASFYGQPVHNRAAIVAAGPIANFILAILIFATIFWISGRPISEAKVDSVQPGSAAEVAGFQPGDVVLAIDGKEIESFSDVQRVVSADAGAKLTFTIRRDGGELTLQATPRLQERKDPFGNPVQVGILGIARSNDPGTVTRKTYGPVGALREGAQETWFIVERTLGYIGGVLVGQQSANQISGPIRIAEISGQAAKLGFEVVMNLAAVLSVSIGLLNLFPIPLLDGGHLMYYALEAVRGRPLSERAQEFGFRVGMAIVLMLMLVATWNDIVHVSGLFTSL